jgi:hypothetical protein
MTRFWRRVAAFDPIADYRSNRQTAPMGKRSGVPHRDDELQRLTNDELQAELDRSRMRLRIATSAKAAKEWRRRIHWLEAAVAQRN